MSISFPIHDASSGEFSARLAELIPTRFLKRQETINEIAARWSERHRVWHNTTHLLTLLEHFQSTSSGSDREILLLVALYHDAIYNPLRSDNEEVSAKLLCTHADDAKNPVIARAAEIIEASKWSVAPSDSLTRRFWEADCQSLASDYPAGLRIAYEMSIFREYQFAPWEIYKSKRGEFLKAWAHRFPEQKHGVEVCLDLLGTLSPRIAVYPGSFNPFHRGHLSILRQAERIFDKVIIGVGVNRQKQGASSSLEQRRTDLQLRLCFHEVAAIPGLLTSYVQNFAQPLSVVRGVRDGTDLEAELRYARFLDELRPGTNVVWIGCEAELQHLSSSAIRELDSIEQHVSERYVPTTAEIYELIEVP